MYFRYFVIISPWKRVWPFIEQTWIPFTQGCFVPSLFEIDLVDFKILLMYFRIFLIISPWKKAGPFIWTNLNPLHRKMHCVKFGWNWLSGSEEEYFLNFVNLFSLFLNYLPLEKGGALHLNKTESPSPKDALCQVWLKMAQWFWRICQCIFAIS